LSEALESPSRHERKVAELLLLLENAADWRWEYWFHPVRKFRFDFACPAIKLAIEIHGGVFTRGRHVRPAGIIADCEKQRIAVAHGWRVLPYVPVSSYLDDMVIDLRCANMILK
jgi:hypothetical protein